MKAEERNVAALAVVGKSQEERNRAGGDGIRNLICRTNAGEVRTRTQDLCALLARYFETSADPTISCSDCKASPLMLRGILKAGGGGLRDRGEV